MMKLTDIERLAVAQAMHNVIGGMVKTKDEGNLRGIVDAQIRDMYERSPLAPKSFDVNLLGRKVGTMSVTVSKPTEQRITTVLEVEDADALLAWAIAEGYAIVDMDRVCKMFSATGEVPDGCEAVEVVEPAEEGGKVTRTTLKVDPEEVAEALGPMLGDAVRDMIGGRDVPRLDS